MWIKESMLQIVLDIDKSGKNDICSINWDVVQATGVDPLIWYPVHGT